MHFLLYIGILDEPEKTLFARQLIELNYRSQNGNFAVVALILHVPKLPLDLIKFLMCIMHC